LQEDARVRLVVVGELDIATVPLFEAAIREERQAQQDVLLDLAGLTFVDSSGIRSLVLAANDARANGWHLSIAGDLTAPVHKALEITGVLALLPISNA
jgi:anti-anti-sigma factor